MSQELEIIDRTYRLTCWLHQRVQKFPRHSRYSLGTRLEDRLLNTFESFINAKYSTIKAEILHNAGIELEQFRFFLRMAKDLKLISIRSHEFAISELSEIRAQLLAWRRYAEQRES